MVATQAASSNERNRPPPRTAWKLDKMGHAEAFRSVERNKNKEGGIKNTIAKEGVGNCRNTRKPVGKLI